MMVIPGYEPTETLYKSHRTSIYRCRRRDEAPVVLKVLTLPTPEETARFKREFETTKRLKGPGIIRALALESFENHLSMVLEDFGGRSLTDLGKNRSPGLAPMEFLQLALRITAILGEIHRQDVIHKDINPSNILLNPQTGEVKLIDFGISTFLPRETLDFSVSHVIEGTPAYMAPEQTGRMNRSIDYRTDFYSLGVTFYELLTGRLPFHGPDTQALIHAHIARTPRPPHHHRPNLPQPISAIVTRLLAKNAEDRYQGTRGLADDLRRCLENLQHHKEIEMFDIGTTDHPEKFQVPQKLYGREKEIKILNQWFDRVSQGGSAMVLVKGYAGIGKTSLVHELYRPIARKRGYFIAGKFAPLKRNIPYAPFISAFRELIRQLLTESSERMQSLKTAIVDAVGVNGRVITDLIPDMKLLIGQQPPIAELLPTESRTRFQEVFENFLRVFARREHPLTIFLDDMQWVDQASLKLVELLLCNGETDSLFIIGAYREDEVDGAHPLQMQLKRLAEQKCNLEVITLPPLGTGHLNHLLADTLHRDPEEVKPLTAICWRKTGGNPFFVNQFLLTLHRHRLIHFDGRRGQWCWNIQKIERVGLTDNVVQLIMDRLEQLPPETLDILKTASVIGIRFAMKILAPAVDKSYHETAACLWHALREQFIIPTDEKYSFADLDDQSNFSELSSCAGYRFAHDRIHQSVYSLLDSRLKVRLHAKIGRLMLSRFSAEERRAQNFDQATLFAVVAHLGNGISMITGAQEILETANLNLTAARRARTSIAYAFGLRYAQTGMELLGAGGWTDHNELMTALCRERVLLEYLNGHGDRAEHFAMRLVEHARNAPEKAAAYNLRVLIHTMAGRHHEAIGAGREGLKLLNMELPVENHGAATAREIAVIGEKLAEKSADLDIASLIDLPKMTDTGKKVAMDILMNLDMPAYYVERPLLDYTAARKVRLSLEYGHTPASCFGYCSYGMQAETDKGNYLRGHAFGQLAFKLSDAFGDPGQKCRVSVLFANYLTPWVKHLKETEAINDAGYQAATASGHREFGAFNLAHKLYNRFYMGTNLGEIWDKIDEYRGFISKARLPIHARAVEGFRLVIGSLLGKTAAWNRFDLDNATDEQHIHLCRKHKMFPPLVDYYIYKAFIHYLHDDAQKALDHINTATEMYPYCANRFSSAQHNFFHSLCLLALYPASAGEDAKQRQQDALAQVAKNQEQMKTWSDHCPDNFLHKYLLVEAESARVNHRHWEALNLYDAAAKTAGKYGYLQEQALAEELAARFWLANNKPDIAALCMVRAYRGWSGWGAVRKARSLEEKYPRLLSEILEAEGAAPNQKKTASLSRTDGNEMSRRFDLHSLIKATRYLSAEIILPVLLHKLMSLILENAGARDGLLVLTRDNAPDNKLYIELKGTAGGTIPPPGAVPLGEHDSPDQPTAIIRYVARTGKSLVLNHPDQEGDFTQSPYIIANRPRSVLCTPILHQGKLSGVIYLENRLTADAFTAERLEVVNILASQAAISIENARLYETLEAKVNERTHQVRGEKERAEMYFDLAGVVMITLDHHLRVQKINKRGREILGYPENRITGKHWLNHFVPAADREHAGAYFRSPDTGEPGESQYLEGSIMTASGETRLLAWHYTPLRDDRDRITGFLGSGEDITERKEAEQNLKAALREKEILLKEIHHRVKNNLQIASSLLGLQSFKIHDPDLVGILDDSIRRLNSMAEIHKLLYETESFDCIPFAPYLEKIVGNYLEPMKDGQNHITVHTDADGMFLDMEKAVPCALIINELLSNAFKYAFPDGRGGDIVIRLAEHDGNYTLVVGNNGVDFPHDLDIKGGRTLGMTIIRGLIAQLGGRMTLKHGHGVEFNIEFPGTGHREKGETA